MMSHARLACRISEETALRTIGLLVARLLLGLAFASSAAAQPVEPIEAVRTAPVVVDGVTLFSVRGTSGTPAEERAALLRARIVEAARDPGFDPQQIELRPIEGGVELRSGPTVLRGVYDADARLEGVETRVLATTLRTRIANTVIRYRADRSPEGVARALRRVAGQTLVLVGALAAIVLLERLVSRLIRRHVAIWEQRARDVVQLRAIWQGVRRALRIAFVAAGLVVVAIYLNAVLLTLPWTRDVGDRMTGLVAQPLRQLGRGFLAALPKLVVLVVIASLTLFAIRIADRFFAAVATGRLRLRNFDQDWAAPTARMVRFALGLLGLVMAYPYIPGSSSEAFRAVSIFVGIVLSLGATSIIANMLAGNSLIYRRAFRVGDRIEVAGVLGDVEAISAQATYLCTLKNERVTIPNSLVLAGQVVNYSRFAEERGLILHTEVGLGHDVPWREAEAMLLEAARRTPALLAAPAPYVLQKRLADTTAVYEINGYTHDAKAAPATYSALIRNIQDVCAERGVQLTTPIHVAGPAAAAMAASDRLPTT